MGLPGKRFRCYARAVTSAMLVFVLASCLSRSEWEAATHNPFVEEIEASRPADVVFPASPPAQAPASVSHKTEPRRVIEAGPPRRIEKGPLRDGAPVLEIVVIDVGQGDAVLVIAPNGKTMLVDAGVAYHARTKPDSPNTFFGRIPADSGKKFVLPYLASRGIASIDLAVGSHPHADHIGGMVSVARALPIEEFVDPGVPYSSDTYATLLEELAQKNVRYRIPQVGDTLALDPSVRITVLGPHSDPDEDVNNSSVVLRIDFDKFSALLTGDAEKEAEHELLANAEDLPVCLLKVGHHGSRSSSTPSFLQAVQPQIAVISCGRNNKFGHPHQKSLDNLVRAGVATIHRTDRDGTVRYRTDGLRLEVVKEGVGATR